MTEIECCVECEVLSTPVERLVVQSTRVQGSNQARDVDSGDIDFSREYCKPGGGMSRERTEGHPGWGSGASIFKGQAEEEASAKESKKVWPVEKALTLQGTPHLYTCPQGPSEPAQPI